MKIEAACKSHRGRIRRNNEDNFCFNRIILEDENTLTTFDARNKPGHGEQFVVFDGMGGENFGEVASLAAAKATSAVRPTLKEWFQPFEEYLHSMIMKINQAVLDAKAEMMTSRMGTTMVSLSFNRGNAYICNIGDSRAYRLRDGQLQQLSIDHVESRPRRQGGKAPLTQHLGIDPEEMMIEPHIAKEPYRTGDRYLLCSDGLTDMLSDAEIAAILLENEDSVGCVDGLIEAALEHGGRDNITVLICKVT